MQEAQRPSPMSLSALASIAVALGDPPRPIGPRDPERGKGMMTKRQRDAVKRAKQTAKKSRRRNAAR